MNDILTVEGLCAEFKTLGGVVKAVNNVSFRIGSGEIVGFVGESGCGKSATMLSVVQLIASPPGRITAGKVVVEGRDLLKLKPRSREMCAVRGSRIAMIFQEPMTSLDPTMTVCQQIAEMVQLHLGLKASEARQRAVELLRSVGIPDAEKRANDHPHQFSGGMRQRVMIAMAMSCRPQLIIADEPTTATDVTTQAQLLELMRDVVVSSQTSLIIVTHNLGVVARYAQRIYVMYAGSIVESGDTKDVLCNPGHPYTIGLISCVPLLGEPSGRKLVPIQGVPPNLVDLPPECPFLPRCQKRSDECAKQPAPQLRQTGERHYVACHLAPAVQVDR
jgi:oligopeptide/dipeptide ABC transporter ATP-binding protein